MTTDIPLKSAMIAWNPKLHADPNYPGVAGRVLVVPWPDHEGKSKLLLCTTGACGADWQETSPINRLRMLFVEAWQIVCRDGIDPHDMHSALMVIPEYRDQLSGEKFFTWELPRVVMRQHAIDKIRHCLAQLKQLPFAHNITPELTVEEVHGALAEALFITNQHSRKH